MLWWTILGIAAGAFLAWMLYILRSGGDFEHTLSTRLYRAWRRIVFFAGDIRLIPNVLAKVPLVGRIPLVNRIPGITWDIHMHQVEYDEAMRALPLIRPGDIGLHRDKGYLSNLAIPGFMKHAWIHINGPVEGLTEDGRPVADVTRMEIVEAVSEGVLRRSALFPIRSDYVVILRPKDAAAEEIDRAITKASRIVGCHYDVNFEFDIEDELELYKTEDHGSSEEDEDRKELERIKTNVRAEWDGCFTCTEVVSFAYWHIRRRLRLFRRPVRGKQVILGDDMIHDAFDIVWMSDSVTPEVAAELGLGEEGVEMIRRYRRG